MAISPLQASREDIDESSVVPETRGQQLILSESHGTNGRQTKRAQNISAQFVFSAVFCYLGTPKMCFALQVRHD